jgi:adenylate cyclase
LDEHRATSVGFSRVLVTVAWVLALLLPLVGLCSLLLRRQLDPAWDGSRLHFVLFLVVGGGAFALAYVAGQAADRRGDARVFLLSLGFLVTGGFLAVHAIGTPGVLIKQELPGFTMAIPIGLLFASVFVCGSACVDRHPGFAPTVMRYRAALRISVLAAMAAWSVWALAALPPLNGSSDEAGGTPLRILAAVGALVYLLAARCYLKLYRRELTLLPASVIACCILLAEALVGSALVGERTWHASWWEWHALIVTAYVVVLYAARAQWRGERFHLLYLPSTRERAQDLSVLFADLVGFTTFVERSSSAEVGAMLAAYYEVAAPLISKGFGGDVEKFMGDAIMATFNTKGDQPDHATRASRAALELQHRMAVLAAAHPDWPRLRVGVNSGCAVVTQLGGPGFVTFAVVGDTINVGSRLEGEAPVGGVLIGAGTYERLPASAEVEARPNLAVKGKRTRVDAYVLNALPAEA